MAVTKASVLSPISLYPIKNASLPPQNITKKYNHRWGLFLKKIHPAQAINGRMMLMLCMTKLIGAPKCERS